MPRDDQSAGRHSDCGYAENPLSAGIEQHLVGHESYGQQARDRPECNAIILYPSGGRSLKHADEYCAISPRDEHRLTNEAQLHLP